MTSQLALTAALFGLCVGSFINVVVWRIPRGGIMHLAGQPLSKMWQKPGMASKYSSFELVFVKREVRVLL